MSALSTRWITVDLGRIRRLPARLRNLWPRELLPDAVEATDRDPAEAAAGNLGKDPENAARNGTQATSETDKNPGASPGGVSADRATASADLRAGTPTATALAELPTEVVRPRDLDVLSAWLAGFAAELNLARSRLSFVVGAAEETLILDLALCDQVCLAILAPRGGGFAEFAGFELLRRLDFAEVAQVCEDLTDLVEGDCILTLTYARAQTGAAVGSAAGTAAGVPTAAGTHQMGSARQSCGTPQPAGTPQTATPPQPGASRSGMEFLQRQAGDWSRPMLTRGEDEVTIAAMEELPDGAVRMLLASTLTRLCGTEAALR